MISVMFVTHPKYTLLSLHTELSQTNAIDWMVSKKILIDEVKCPKCNIDMIRNGKDMRCNKQQCRKKQSIFKNTFFFHMRLDYSKFFMILYCWLWKYPAFVTIHENGISSETYANHSNYFRELCQNFTFMKSQKTIGGDGHVVQIDEMCVGKRKYNVGRMPAHGQEWYFGGIDMETKEVFYCFVENRSSAVLMEKIRQHILPGTIIWSDSWKGYVDVDEEFEHDMVNHKQEFVAFDGTNTQQIEATNGAVRRLLKRNGTHLEEDHLDFYFEEYIWRKRNQKNMIFSNNF